MEPNPGLNQPEHHQTNHFELDTGIPGLKVAPLTRADTDRYYALVQDNTAHLTADGDYSDEVTATKLDISTELSKDDGNLRCGLYQHECLIGRVDLSPREPGIYVLGYWLSSTETGRGYATAGCQTLIDYAKERLSATSIYAGVTKGNIASEKLLDRLGFTCVTNLETYNRFHLRLI